MKKLLLSVLGILFITLFFVSATIAQEKTNLHIQRKIELKNDSEVKNVKVEINEEGCQFNLKIQSRVIEGELSVEIYNMEGKKQGNFSVGTQIVSENAKEEVNGLIRKSIDNAPIGIWTIKITPKNVTGYITINYSQDKIVKK